MFNKKHIVIFLAILTFFMSVAVAADVNETTDFTTSDASIATQDTTNVQNIQTIANEDNNKITKENKNIKEDTASTIPVDNDNFDDYFTNAGLTGVDDGDTITFTSDVSRTSNSYIVNKQVNILGNNYTLDLNTINGYDSQSNPTYIEFNSQASNSNISYLKFHNTQVFTTTATNITFDHITDTIDNQGVGKGTGYFAMRTGVSNITVKNSYFYAANNTGCSAVVITFGENCTIDNNTIIGQGTVGNLVYLNQFGQSGNGITQNKNNTISNNIIIGPDEASSICHAITIGGPHNHIINNTINYTGIGIVGNWAGTYDPATNTTNDYYNDTYLGNGYINNTINNGASFSGAQGSLVAGNTFTGTTTIAKESTVKDNTFYGPVTINQYTNVTNNKFNSTVTLKNNINFKNNNAENSTLYVNGSNCDLCNDTVNTIVLKSGITNISICFDMFGVNIEGNTSVINWYSHPSSLALTKKLSKSLKSVKSDGEPQVIDITEENYSTYFRNNTYNSYMMSSVITTDTIFNLYYVPENINQFQIANLHSHHLTFVGKNNLTIRNVKFQTQGANLLIKDINVIYEDVYFGNVFIGLAYASQGDALPLIWDNITINISNYDEDKYDGGTLSSPIRQASASSGQKNIIVRNSVINANLPATNGNSLISVSGISFINNSINLNETMGLVDSPSLIAMDLTTESGVSVVVEGNNITVLGESNLVGIKFEESVTDSNITNNIITVTSTEGTATGVELAGNNNTVTDNYIATTYKSGNDAVTVTGENNVVENNIGPEIDTRIVTSIELDNNDNPIDVGERLIIRGLFKANKVESETSDIKVYDNDELIATINSDEFGTIAYAYIPTVSGSHNITFAFEGNDTHKNTSTIITVEVNEVVEPTKEYTLKIDTTEFTQGTKATIMATIYYGNENEQEIANNINKGKVVFKVNGKTLKDENSKVIYAKVINGTAKIENYQIPTTWKENSTIEATYSGSTEVSKLTSEKQNITITQEELTLTTEDKTATANTTIILTATLSDKTLNTGKIVFKVNGKTVKDSNGKVIYAKVINGTVSVEYTIPENMKADNYTITAVYTSTNYPKLEDSKTLTIN